MHKNFLVLKIYLNIFLILCVYNLIFNDNVIFHISDYGN